MLANKREGEEDVCELARTLAIRCSTLKHIFREEVKRRTEYLQGDHLGFNTGNGEKLSYTAKQSQAGQTSC